MQHALLFERADCIATHTHLSLSGESFHLFTHSARNKFLSNRICFFLDGDLKFQLHSAFEGSVGLGLVTLTIISLLIVVTIVLVYVWWRRRNLLPSYYRGYHPEVAFWKETDDGEPTLDFTLAKPN
jgi:hypothetical protein